MGRTVQFTMGEDDYAPFLAYAEGKGLTLSALAKMALYQYRERYPYSGRGKGSRTQPRVRAVQAGAEDRGAGA